jgi:hypothetical protein
MDVRHKNKILNIIFYILLAYQFALLILGVFQYVINIHLTILLYPFSLFLIYFYLFACYTKESLIHWHSVRFKLEEKDEPDISAGEMIYNLQKRIVLSLIIIVSILCVIFAFVDLFQNSAALFPHILSIYGFSAVLIFILTIAVALVSLIRFIKKPWKKTGLLFNLLLLQNFLLSTAILKMLSNIQL